METAGVDPQKEGQEGEEELCRRERIRVTIYYQHVYGASGLSGQLGMLLLACEASRLKTTNSKSGFQGQLYNQYANCKKFGNS